MMLIRQALYFILIKKARLTVLSCKLYLYFCHQNVSVLCFIVDSLLHTQFYCMSWERDLSVVALFFLVFFKFFAC